MPTTTEIVLIAQETANLDTTVLRGSASLADLAAISDADVFDQVANPDGLQRDLSLKHAQEAYIYAEPKPDPKREQPRAFPEVILNVRDKSVVSVEPLNLGRQRMIKGVKLTFDLDKIVAKHKGTTIGMSRVDGNHRLFFAGGDERHDPLTEQMVPFQIHMGLTRDQEAGLFVDVNANQKGLNSSHLHFLRMRLTTEEQEMRDFPERVFARKLAEDKESPWFGLVYMGGSKRGAKEAGLVRPVAFVTLESAIKRILSKSQYIHDLTVADAQYVLIRNFWQAVKEVFPYEWETPKDYYLLKNIGVLSFAIYGGTVIDRTMARGEVTPEAMKQYVRQARGVFDWSRTATGEKSVVGMSGNKAALLIAGEMASNLTDPGESEAMRRIQERLIPEVVKDKVAA